MNSRERFLAEYERRKLHSVQELPRLAGDSLAFEWHMTAEGENLTVIRCEDKEVCKEPALWEGVSSFYEVKALLKQRYGSQVQSLTPAPASEAWLYGDGRTQSVDTT